MPKDKILTFADKAREINKRYGIKSTSDLDDLSQIDMRSYTIEMDRLKEKQEAFKQANLPQNPMTNPALRNSQEGEFAFGGGIKKYSGLDGTSTVQPTNDYDNVGEYELEAKRYSSAGKYDPVRKTVKMSNRDAEEINVLNDRLNSVKKYIQNAGYDTSKGLKETSVSDPKLKSLLLQARKDQSRLNELSKSNGIEGDSGSLGFLEGAFKGDEINDSYKVGDFANNQYWGDRSNSYSVTAKTKPKTVAGEKTVDYTDGTWEKNPEYKAYKSPVGIQALSTAVGLAPYTQKTHERPITYTPAKPGYVNYEPERQMAIQQGIMQGENLGRDLVNTGATRGQVAQGIIQGRLGINRQVGNMYNKSFQDQTNTNAGIYGQNQMYNAGLQNKAIDENYKDARYAEEMNFMKKQAIAKGLSDFGSQMTTDKYNEYLINSAGNSDAEGNTRWIQKSGAVNQPQPIQATSAQNTYQSQGNPMLQPWQRNLAVQGTKLRYPNMNQNNSYAMYEDGGELRKYYKGESLIGKFNFRR